MKRILYICDVSLPNKSAYVVHVMKMCEAFAKNYRVDLLVNHNNQRWNDIKKNYNLDCKINILSQQRFKNSNFFFRIINGFKAIKLVNNKKYYLVISRNIISSILLAIFDKKNVLEIHTEMTGFTKKLFNFFLAKIKQNIKFIFIHKELSKIFKFHNKFIILDDAINLKDFKKLNIGTVKNKFVYTGSYIEGKGIELVVELARHFKKYKFYLYGNIDTFPKKLIDKKKNLRNIFVNDYINYSQIPSVLKSAEFLLMPYPKKIGVLMKNVNVSSYISPLKMFEYLAAKKVIFASDNKAYGHILRDNYNSILISPSNKKKWIKRIKEVISNKARYSSLKENAIKTVKDFTWEKRSKKIIKFINEK